MLRHGVATSSNKKEAEKFMNEFLDLMKAEGFIPQWILKGDEASLFYKKLPNHAFITKEGKALPGHKPMKDRLTLLMCGNGSGDFKAFGLSLR